MTATYSNTKQKSARHQANEVEILHNKHFTIPVTLETLFRRTASGFQTNFFPRFQENAVLASEIEPYKLAS